MVSGFGGAGFRVQGGFFCFQGLKGLGLGFRVWGVGFRVRKVQGSGFRVWGLAATALDKGLFTPAPHSTSRGIQPPESFREKRLAYLRLIDLCITQL